jgi:hypothetical protein
MNYLKLYKSNKKTNDLNFLTKTCEYFLNDYLSSEVVKEFLGDKIPNEDSVMKSIKKLCKFDENTVFIPHQEIKDIVNFSIFTEREDILNQILEKSFEKKHKLSNILKKGIHENTYVNKEEIYQDSEIRDFIIKKSKNITNDVSEKDGYIIVSFN